MIDPAQTEVDVAATAASGDRPDPARSSRERRRARRIARWERPPDPHDWRFFVGGLGRIMIALGLLLFGFVAYQLWGTGIATARAQNRLEQQFAELLVDDPTASTPGPVPTYPPADPAELPTFDAPPVTIPGAPPTPPAATIEPETVVERPTPDVRRGDALARLQIPRLDKDLIVVAGVALDDLQDGPGHYPNTPLPGQLGNAAIAGHRTTWGEPFRHVDLLEPGDELVVTMGDGAVFVYRVWYSEIVAATAFEVVTTRDPTVAELTLTSCHPVYTSRDRIVVHALLDPAVSSPVGVSAPYDFDDQDAAEAEPTAANESVVAPPASTAATKSASTAPAESSAPPIQSAPASDTAPVAATANETTTAHTASTSDPPSAPAAGEHAADATDAAAGQLDDAFGDGWFHDPAAWPHVIGWGLVLAAIAWVVRRLARRLRSYPVAVAGGVVPFLVCLYFFYANVNRLLPPGL